MKVKVCLANVMLSAFGLGLSFPLIFHVKPVEFITGWILVPTFWLLMITNWVLFTERNQNE